MLDKELEQTLNSLFAEAREQRYEFMTIEHLLFALLNNNSATAVLNACGANLNSLHDDLIKFIQKNSTIIDDIDERDTQPTIGFQRVLQRAAIHVQSSGRESVTGANMIVALFSEKESHAVYFLHQQNMTRLDAVQYISHGISKVQEDEDGEEIVEETIDGQQQKKSSKKALDQFCINLNKKSQDGKIDP